MRALQLEAPMELNVIDIDMPQIAADEVLLKVSYAGICGSDLHTYKGHNPRAKYPQILGHEMSGEIVELGADHSGGLAAGDLVTVNPFVYCGECPSCKGGLPHVCKNFALYGIDRPGMFAQYVKVKSDRLHKVPSHIPLDMAALAEPYAVGVHAVNCAGMKMGDKVVVLGGGPIGLMCALAAQAAGAGQIIVTQVNEYRRALTQQLGFVTVNGRGDDLKEQVMEYTGGTGADVVFEAVGTAETAAQMTGILRTRGTAVIVGLYSQLAGVNLRDVLARELFITGSMAYTNRDFETALTNLPVPQIKQMVTHRFPLESAVEGFHAVTATKEAMKVLIEP